MPAALTLFKLGLLRANLRSLGTFWRTVRYLKPGQLIGRVIFHLWKPAPQLALAPPRRLWRGHWVSPAARRPSLVGLQRFSFLGIEGELDQLGWVGADAEKLWRYNQHYFDDLNAQDACSRRAWHTELIARWLAENPPSKGDGWEPYPTSLRIGNWIKASASGFDLSPTAWQSLAVQTRWLVRRLEWHLLGNHLFVNAKALVLAGLIFDGVEARRWLLQGLAVLRKQLPEQILSDGGHFERSPMYHALALEDLLDLINAARASQVAEVENEISSWCDVATKMLGWLRSMTHPDGRLSRFNDSADGIAPSNSELERYASALGLTISTISTSGVTHLAASGYVRSDWSDAVALLDVAPLGPDYLPGHAHADTLSFELSVRGRLLVVNGGTSCYGQGSRRSFERGTAAHSTVQVGSYDSSEVWAGFRVGRRARPVGVCVSNDAIGSPQVRASHDGYRWLPGKPLHYRTWTFIPDGIEIKDKIIASKMEAVARYHLGPGLALEPMTPDLWLVRFEGVTLARVRVVEGEAFDEASSFAPEFGQLIATRCLAVRLHEGCALTHWAWDRSIEPE